MLNNNPWDGKFLGQAIVFKPYYAMPGSAAVSDYGTANYIFRKGSDVSSVSSNSTSYNIVWNASYTVEALRLDVGELNILDGYVLNWY